MNKQFAFTSKASTASIVKSPSLVFCLLMDAIGFCTYAVPFFGEFADIIWAPVSALIFMISFGGMQGVVGGVFNFMEEILPGTDFVPSFTLAWCIRNVGTQKQKKVRAL